METTNPISTTPVSHDRILHLAFNQDFGCFTCSTESGFLIYNTDPYKETFNRQMEGGLNYIEMLYRTNILALIGGGKRPKYPMNKVILWDDHQTKTIGEMTFRTEVKSVHLRSNKTVIVLESKIFVYNFSDLKLIDHIETVSNPKGLCALNNDPDITILACPDKVVGYVAVFNYEEKTSKTIKAHQSPLSCLELNAKGTKLATASEKGTIIRIYNTVDGSQLHELRRGTEHADIGSMRFDSSGKWFACSSDSSTVHIFKLKLLDQEKTAADAEDDKGKNPKSKLAFMKFVSDYFDAEWSFAQIRIPDKKTKIAFCPDQPNTIVIISYEGNYYKAEFDPIKGGEAKEPKPLKFFTP